MARRCEYHPAYQWLTGYAGVNHHSLSDFRVAHQAALDELFAQVLGVLSAEGLITLEPVMHDGTIVKAQATSRRAWAPVQAKGAIQPWSVAASGTPSPRPLADRIEHGWPRTT